MKFSVKQMLGRNVKAFTPLELTLSCHCQPYLNQHKNSVRSFNLLIIWVSSKFILPFVECQTILLSFVNMFILLFIESSLLHCVCVVALIWIRTDSKTFKQLCLLVILRMYFTVILRRTFKLITVLCDELTSCGRFFGRLQFK